MKIFQITYTSSADPPKGYRIIGHSPQLPPRLLARFEEVCQQFGSFSLDFQHAHLGFSYDELYCCAKVQRASRKDFAGRDFLNIHALVLHHKDFSSIDADPFVLEKAGLFREKDSARDDFSILEWAAPTTPDHTIWQQLPTHVSRELCAYLLEQILASKRLLILSDTPQPLLVRAIMRALPLTRRLHFAFASMVFSPARPYDLAVMPARFARLQPSHYDQCISLCGPVPSLYSPYVDQIMTYWQQAQWRQLHLFAQTSSLPLLHSQAHTHPPPQVPRPWRWYVMALCGWLLAILASLLTYSYYRKVINLERALQALEEQLTRQANGMDTSLSPKLRNLKLIRSKN